MLEVVFSKNAAGALKVAQHCGDGGHGKVVSVFRVSDEEPAPSKGEQAEARRRAEEAMKRRQKHAVSLGGNHWDVFGFDDDLSVGDISGDCLSQRRRHYISETYALFPEDCTHMLNSLEKGKETLEELVRHSGSGEAIRLWYSEQPYEYCGMCWLISELKKRMTELPRMSAIELPRRVAVGDTIVNYMGWGGVSPEEFHTFLPLEKEVTPAFVCAATLKWREMQEQDAPLRAVINGTLQSVPEDFYDFFIRKEIDRMDDEFHEADLICRILGQCQLGIGFTWAALRIEKMIEHGLLVPITQPEPGDMIYRRMLRKNTSNTLCNH